MLPLTKRMVLLAALIAISIVAGASQTSCSKGDDALAPVEAIDASMESLRAIDSVLIRLNITYDTPDGSTTTYTEVGYESDEIMFSRYVVDDDATEALSDFIETIFVPDDVYLHARSGGWYVLSPWSQGEPIDAAVLPDDGFADLKSYYDDEILQYTEDVVRGDNERIDGTEYYRYDGVFEPRGGPDGTAIYWLDRETYLPRKIQIDVAEHRLGFRFVMEFIDYDLPVLLPSIPEDVLPYRDYLLPDAPCSADEFEPCLAAQKALTDHVGGLCPGEGRRVCLVPYGQVDPSLVRDLAAYYLEEYGLTVGIIEPEEIRADQSDPLRGQVEARELVEWMSFRHGAGFDPDAVYIGLTPVDLYTEDSHSFYVFGSKRTWAHPYGVISTFRMNPETYGDPRDDDLLLARTRKMLTKYIGLLYYGLSESTDPTSPLFGGIGGVEDLDDVSDRPLDVAPASQPDP